MRLNGVGKRYGLWQPWVVREVSLRIRSGALIRLEGKNGAGKSTLLRVIAGATAPSTGTVTGRPVTGYVPERFPAALPFPAHAYLAHVGRVHGLADDDLAGRIRACLDRMGGAELADVPLRHMSKGMCQKVAVTQALLPGSGLLVLDEAWTGLDADAKAALDGAVAERLAQGGAVVFVDHDQSRLAGLGAERWRLEGGRATLVAPAAERAALARAVGAGQARAPVVIEVCGHPPDLLELYPADWLPGVLTAGEERGLLVLRVDPSASDEVLRRLLATGHDVHVRGVYPERGTTGGTPAGGTPAGGTPAGGAP